MAGSLGAFQAIISNKAAAVSLDVKLSQQSFFELQNAKKDLKKLSTSADKVIKKQERAKRGAATLRAGRGGRGLSAVRKTPRMLSFTSEGIVAGGVLKLSDTGFMLEGVVAKYGGPLLAAAVIGRVGAGIAGGVIKARDMIREGHSVLDAVRTVGASGAVELPLTVARASGVLPAGIALAALIDGGSTEDAQANFNEGLENIKKFFGASIEQKIADATQNVLDKLEQAKEADVNKSHAAILERWGLGGVDSISVRNELVQSTRRSLSRLREVNRVKLAKEVPEKGGG